MPNPASSGYQRGAEARRDSSSGGTGALRGSFSGGTGALHGSASRGTGARSGTGALHGSSSGSAGARGGTSRAAPASQRAIAATEAASEQGNRARDRPAPNPLGNGGVRREPRGDHKQRYRKLGVRLGGPEVDTKAFLKGLKSCVDFIGSRILSLTGLNFFVVDPAMYPSLRSLDLAGVYGVFTFCYAVQVSVLSRTFGSGFGNTDLLWYEGVQGLSNDSSNDFASFFAESTDDIMRLRREIDHGAFYNDALAVLIPAFQRDESGAVIEDVVRRLMAGNGGLVNLDFVSIASRHAFSPDTVPYGGWFGVKARVSDGEQNLEDRGNSTQPVASDRRTPRVSKSDVSDRRTPRVSKSDVKEPRSHRGSRGGRASSGKAEVQSSGPSLAPVNVCPVMLPPLPAQKQDDLCQELAFSINPIFKVGPMDPHQLEQFGRSVPLPGIVCSSDGVDVAPPAPSALDQPFGSVGGSYDHASYGTGSLAGYDRGCDGTDSCDMDGVSYDGLVSDTEPQAAQRDHSNDLGLFGADGDAVPEQFVTDEEAIESFALDGNLAALGQAADALSLKVKAPANSRFKFYGDLLGGYPSLHSLSQALDSYDECRRVVLHSTGIELPPNPLHCNGAFIEAMPFQLTKVGTEVLEAIRAIGDNCGDLLSLRLCFVEPSTWSFVVAVMLVRLLHPFVLPRSSI
jgi:hypothetical protein